jgi:hypothetical protein
MAALPGRTPSTTFIEGLINPSINLDFDLASVEPSQGAAATDDELLPSVERSRHCIFSRFQLHDLVAFEKI